MPEFTAWREQHGLDGCTPQFGHQTDRCLYRRCKRVRVRGEWKDREEAVVYLCAALRVADEALTKARADHLEYVRRWG